MTDRVILGLTPNVIPGLTGNLIIAACSTWNTL